jgi:hypothetical protein
LGLTGTSDLVVLSFGALGWFLVELVLTLLAGVTPRRTGPRTGRCRLFRKKCFGADKQICCEGLIFVIIIVVALVIVRVILSVVIEGALCGLRWSKRKTGQLFKIFI